MSVDGRPGWLRDDTEQTDAFGPRALESVVLELEWWDTMKPRAGKRISRLRSTAAPTDLLTLCVSPEWIRPSHVGSLAQTHRGP